MTDINVNIEDIVAEGEKKLSPVFEEIDKISAINTKRVLDAFREEKVSDSMFASTSGYGYDDRGRDTLDRIYARVFGCESAFARHSIASGTHTLAIALFGVLRPGDILLSVTGKPYDTLDEVIGIRGEKGRGSLSDFGVEYDKVELLPDGDVDLNKIREKLLSLGDKVRVAFIQRSKGYLNRKTLSCARIKEICDLVHSCSNAIVFVDNCYGEFTETCEPTAVGADLMAGSLIKNPGGGMAESGGYIAGKKELVELCGYRFTAVGVGLEIGATLGNNKALYKGFFYAPHTVAQAIKTAHLAAYVFEKLGYETEPLWGEKRFDIIQTVKCGSRDAMIALCRGIQYASPVDSFVDCEPWAMPGYSDEVIMAAGTFTQGSSVELSADGPVKSPYTVYIQGALTYESGKIGIISAAKEVMKTRKP
ncbi:MAG: methionine gamma-lyase family protein [Eubacteriales bacterium]|nr:methionine gamma-lyase family protein [Eubacteriales bacterium]